MHSQIGKVSFFFDKPTCARMYIDSTDTFLKDFFDQPQSAKEEDINNLLISKPNWPIISNLSPQRQCLLDWYEFDKNSILLEIGAGCGALTGLFTQRVQQVYANELNPIRAETIAKRYADCENLEVYAMNLSNFKLKEKVDYITVIGVLEYSGAFMPYSNNQFYEPYLNFLLSLKQLLKPTGKILLSIENPIGMKYLVGGKEDHYNNLFSSLENYPHFNGVRTFSKSSLTHLFNQAGFNTLYFYYPYPDYKLPQIVLSQDTFSNHLLNLSFSNFLAVTDVSNYRLPLLNEILLGRHLFNEHILEIFSNSFLIEASL